MILDFNILSAPGTHCQGSSLYCQKFSFVFEYPNIPSCIFHYFIHTFAVNLHFQNHFDFLANVWYPYLYNLPERNNTVKERKYKEDYILESYIDEKGREKRRAVYRGDWFSLAEADRKPVRIQATACAAVFAAAYLGYMKLTPPSANCMYVLPIAACAVIPLLYWLMGTFSMWRAPEKMTRLQKESSIGRVLRSAVGCAALVGMACLGDVFFLLNSGKGQLTQELPGLILLLAALAAALGCFLRARDVFDRIRKTAAPKEARK